MARLTLFSYLFKLFPESNTKNRIRCYLYNQSQKDFTYHYANGIFSVSSAEMDMKFADNPYHVLQSDKDYFRRKKIKPGDAVIDGGAFIGAFTIQAAKMAGPKGHVFAFEPDPETGKKLKKNIALNNLSNVTVIEKGLWSENTVLKFNTGLELASSFIQEGETPKSNTIEIPVTTIDTVLENYLVSGNLFVKMNIEGSEIEAIKGAVKSIDRYRPHFVIRTNHTVNGAFTDKPVEELLKANGYKTSTVTLSELTTFGE